MKRVFNFINEGSSPLNTHIWYTITCKIILIGAMCSTLRNLNSFPVCNYSAILRNAIAQAKSIARKGILIKIHFSFLIILALIV